MMNIARITSLSMFVVLALVAADVRGQAQVDDDQTVTLNFPENMEVKLLAEMVSRQLNINVVFDEQVANKRITIKSPQSIPKKSLQGLLDSVLKMKGLAMIDDDQPGWKRIVAASNLMPIATPIKDAEAAKKLEATAAVTQIFKLQHTDTKRVAQILRPFLTQPGANTVEMEDQNLLIVTEYAANIGRIGELIKLADQPLATIVMKFVSVKHLEASSLAQQVNQLLQTKARAGGTRAVGSPAIGGAAASGGGVEITQDARTNQLVVIGTEERVEEALEIAASLDVALPMETKVYQLTSASPERIDRLTKELIGPLKSTRLYRSAIDKEAGMLIVTGSADVHETITSLMKDLDVPVSEQQSPVRFYKLANATAADVLETIRLIESGDSLSAAKIEGMNVPQPNSPVPGTPGTPGSAGARTGLGPDVPPTAVRPLPPAGATEPDRSGLGLTPTLRSVQARQATVTADPNTNTLIVVADPAAQRVYEQLIRMLDRRRPQVLIEATIVSLDTTDGFSLGVEIGRSTEIGNSGRVITFNSFGLSEVNELGRLMPIPGAGFNGALISPELADIVIRALANNARAKVVSAPRILVNDNATGTLSSVTEEPFVSVNASDTVATTSFAGFVSAGTDVSVTPQISEGDYLKLNFSIALNSFSGAGSEGIPPPRQTNSVNSEVTIPDGHTIIVGGLNRHNFSKTRQTVPFLGEIPLLKELLSSQTNNESSNTLFVFIRPIILRDDKFEDLKYFSERDRSKAELDPAYPSSRPMLMR